MPPGRAYVAATMRAINWSRHWTMGHQHDTKDSALGVPCADECRFIAQIAWMAPVHCRHWGGTFELAL
jgi:hypothetical protein